LTAQSPNPDDTPPAAKDLPQTAGPNPHDISSYWELKDIPSYRPARGTRASLTPQYQAKLDKERAEQAKNPVPASPIPTASRYCTPMGMPFMMGQSPPINIVQAKNEVLIFSEQHSSARHIYLDGRLHPPADILERTTNGHSIGHWEGDNLIVDTVGFIDNVGMTGVNGGGVRASSSHLTENFHLIDNGNKLSYQATWDDPEMYAKPITYTYIFFRDPPDSFSMDEGCDAGDTYQGQK
jgi:hypothetical protein